MSASPARGDRATADRPAPIPTVYRAGEPIERRAVASSNIKSIGIDVVHHILEVEFLSGDVYRYIPVPYAVYHDFLLAESKGAYFARRVRLVYPYAKVASAPPAETVAPDA